MANGSESERSYIETSALLAALLDKQPAAKRALERAVRPYASRLTFVEARRAVIRARAGGQLDAAQERAVVHAIQTFAAECHTVPLTEEILERASRPFPVEPLRTLGAVHLATAEFPADPPALVTIVTCDRRVRANALAMGFQAP